MWLATKFGFYSIVQKQALDDGGSPCFHVRARVRTDLENLLTATGLQREILEWPDADYRYRIIIDAEDLTHLMLVLVENLDYGNFKSMIAATPEQRGKLHAYHEIWEVMARLQRQI